MRYDSDLDVLDIVDCVEVEEEGVSKHKGLGVHQSRERQVAVSALLVEEGKGRDVVHFL